MLKNKFFYSSLLLCLSVFGVWLVAHWPGFFSYDTFFVFESAADRIYDDWLSYIYIVYVKLFGIPGASAGWLGLVQVIYVSILASLTFTFFYQRLQWKWLVAVLLLGFVLLPLNAITILYYVRDSLFAWLLVFLSMGIGIQYWLVNREGLKVRWSSLFAIALFTAITLRLRSDALPLLFLVPFIVWRGFALSNLQKRVFLGFFALALLVFYIVLPTALDIKRSPEKYKITAVLNPLAFIVSQNYRTEDRVKDQEVISRVIDFDRLITERSDYEIPAFHNGALKGNFTEHLVPFYKTTFRIFVTNPELFLENRFRMFGSIAGFYAKNYYSDGLIENYNYAALNKARFNLFKLWPDSELNIWLTKKARSLLFSSGWWQALLSTALLPLLVSMVALIGFKVFPISAMVSALVNARLVFVFFLAPAGMFKYIYPTYLLMFFLIPLMALEWQLKRQKS